MPEQQQKRNALALAVLGVALLAGVAARFKGLGVWPLAIDEYYLARSVQNILRSGLPEYLCGGYYTRGLIFQYIAAGLELAGFTSELAPRLIAAICNLILLPGAYLVARRVGGRTVGLLIVIVLVLSIWEIEIARFGRMYAPFQALFMYYIYFLLRYTLDRDQRALAPMLVLSVLGVFVWEGGVFLGLTNFLPLFVDRGGSQALNRPETTRADVMSFIRANGVYTALAFVIFVITYKIATSDLRYWSKIPALPSSYEGGEEISDADTPSTHLLDPTVAPYSTLPHHKLWLAFAIVPAALSMLALRWIFSFRGRWLTVLGLLATLGAAAAQQFSAVVSILVLMLLLNFIDWKTLTSRRALSFHAALLAWLLFWVAYGFVTKDWRAQASPQLAKVAFFLFYELFRFPDFLIEVALPWGRAIPLMSLGLLLLIVAAAARVIVREPQGRPSDERLALIVIIALVLAACASHPPRHETRYVFFLYPLMLIVAATMLSHILAAVRMRAEWRSPVLFVTGLAAFLCTEDFRPAHMRHIDAANVNFRMGMSSALKSHYHPRSDIRSPAQWLQRHVDPKALVINDYPGVDFYYRGFDFTYISYDEQRYEAYACKEGSVERWGNTPLLADQREIEAELAKLRAGYLVTGINRIDFWREKLARWHPRLMWVSSDRNVAILALNDPPFGN
jgi:hypothetical protein